MEDEDQDRTIALKVQRPDMLRYVSLDLYLLRNFYGFVEDCTALYSRVVSASPSTSTDGAQAQAQATP